MSDKLGNLVNLFCQMVTGVQDTDIFAMGLCGPRCLLTQVMAALLESRDDKSALEQFHHCLTELDSTIKEGFLPDEYKPDATLPWRWAGLARLVQSEFVERASDEFSACLKDAKKSFDSVWREAKLDNALTSPSIADLTPARSADKLFSTVDKHLQPWTPGSWMVWDVLCQWNKTSVPLAVETTRVLFGRGGGGRVLRLVVEALPGPPGFVTPNWWQLGLCAFPSGDTSRFLLPAIQRVMQRAAATGATFRLRWHLDADQRDAWMFGLDGRSVEAAAAVATLAILERHQESESEPILDDNAAVTGVVAEGEATNPRNWLVTPVARGTLSAKFVAAAKLGIDKIAVPAEQPRDGVVVPEGVLVEEVRTVGEAFELLRAVNRAFDRYGDWVRSQFQYHEEETPASR